MDNLQLKIDSDAFPINNQFINIYHQVKYDNAVQIQIVQNELIIHKETIDTKLFAINEMIKMNIVFYQQK